MLLTFSGSKLGMLLNLLYGTGQPLQQGIIWPKMSLAPRMSSSELTVEEMVAQGRGCDLPRVTHKVDT